MQGKQEENNSGETLMETCIKQTNSSSQALQEFQIDPVFDSADLPPEVRGLRKAFSAVET